MEEIKNLLINVQQELKKQKQDMTEMKEDIKNTINNNINEKFKNLEIKNEVIEKKLEEQAKKINILERQIRRKNLVLFGATETEKSYEDLEKIIITIINTYFKVSCDNNNIESVRRLGKKGDKPRPVVITFTTMGLKIKIQTNKKSLQNTQYYIKEDYPLEVLNKRRELQTQLLKEKEAGHTAYIKYDQLIVLHNNKNSTNNQLNKRNLSESPELPNHSSQTVQHNNRQPLKKNKASNMKDYIIQKPKQFYTKTDTADNRTMITSPSNNLA